MEVCVIGAGAAGLMAAVAQRRRCRSGGDAPGSHGKTWEKRSASPETAAAISQTAGIQNATFRIFRTPRRPPTAF